MKIFIRFSALLLIISFFGLNEARALETSTRILEFNSEVSTDNSVLRTINFDGTKKWEFTTSDSLSMADKSTNIKTIYTSYTNTS